MSAAPASTAPQLAPRLRNVRVGVRADLDVSRHVFRGEPAYVICDPITLQSHRLSIADYEILVRIDATQTLGELFASLVANRRASAEQEEAFYAFVFTLHRLGFLSLPVADEALLFKRHEARRAAQARQRWLSFLSLRVPLVNPDVFLGRTLPAARWLFTRTAFTCWLGLIAAAVGVAFARRADLLEPLQGVLVAGNLLALWPTLIVLKLFHELGHAYACKRFGAHVPEMGVNLIMLTPCAYVDASASWGFPRKLHRVIVCLAGMYVESIFAAAAILVWSLTEPGMVHAIAYNVMFLASVTTVLFNINPLMRFDGYYLASDLLEIPNLSQRSTEYTVACAKRAAFGVAPADRPATRRMRGILLAYGIGASLYRTSVMLSIAAVLAIKLGTFGLAAGVIYVGQLLFRKLKTMLVYLTTSDETAPQRTRALVVGGLAIVGLPIALLSIPIRSQVYAPAYVGAEIEHEIVARTPGFVVAVPQTQGRVVHSGEPLVELVNDESALRVLEAQTQLRLAKLRCEALEALDPGESESARRALAAVEARCAEALADDAALRPSSVISGRLVASLRPTDIGRYLPVGAPIATVVAGPWQARAVLTQSRLAAAMPHIGDRADIRVAGVDHTIEGRIDAVRPAAQHSLGSRGLALDAGGEIPVDAQGRTTEPYFEVVIVLPAGVELRSGMTGEVRLAAHFEPLGVELYRRAVRLVHNVLKS